MDMRILSAWGHERLNHTTWYERNKRNERSRGSALCWYGEAECRPASSLLRSYYINVFIFWKLQPGNWRCQYVLAVRRACTWLSSNSLTPLQTGSHAYMYNLFGVSMTKGPCSFVIYISAAVSCFFFSSFFLSLIDMCTYDNFYERQEILSGVYVVFLSPDERVMC